MFALPLSSLYPEDLDSQIADFLNAEIDSFNNACDEQDDFCNDIQDFLNAEIDSFNLEYETFIAQEWTKTLAVDDVVAHDEFGFGTIFSRAYAPENASGDWWMVCFDDGQFVKCSALELS